MCLRCSVFADLQMYLSKCTSICLHAEVFVHLQEYLSTCRCICPHADSFVHMQKYLFKCRSIFPRADVFEFAGLQKPSVCSVTTPTGLPDEAHLQTTVMINCIRQAQLSIIQLQLSIIGQAQPSNRSCGELGTTGGVRS